VTTALLVGAFLAASPLPVGAAAAEDRPAIDRPTIDGASEARALSDQGMAHFKRGDYDRAIAAFQRSYELSPAPALLFDLAQAYRRKGDCAEAVALFRRFALLDPGAAQRSNVSARVEEMDACASVSSSCDHRDVVR
jgi:Flp pilus assembly protein TadD